MKSARTIAGSVLAAVLIAGQLGGCAATEADGQSKVLEGLDILFPQDTIVQFHFKTPAGFQALVDSYIAKGTPEYVNAEMTFQEEEFLDSVGLRLRAPTVAGPGENQKKFPLKVNFNYFGGERFHSLDKIYLSNNNKDPSLMRERLASRILEEMGVPASRTAYAWVKADDQVLGLFTLIEEVDKRFMRARFGTKDNADDGNLYECELPGCDLTWKGNTKADYLDTSCLEEDGCGLVLKTNEDDVTKNDYADLIAFLDLLNNEPEESFKAKFEAAFDVDTFLRYLAVAVAIGDYDGYMGSIDNFFLYHREDIGKWVFIPRDHRRAFGIKGCALAIHPTGVGPQSPKCTTESRPLLDRVLAVPEWKAQYLVYLKQVVDQYLDETLVQGWVDQWDALVAPTLAEDPKALVTQAEYEVAKGSTAQADKDLNLMEFVGKRKAYLSEQLAEVE